ncbi:MAG: M48 family metalloprotease [Planctomycetota bacterium]|nr:M48 family metalloprotease [Planctomycetota bacterium]
MNAIQRTLSALLLLAPLTACATDRQVIEQANDAHHELEPAVLKDPELAGYLQSMGDRIVGEAKKLSDARFGPKSHFDEDPAWMFSNSQFHFVNSETLNAFTTGGSHMYIYTQLLQQCRSEDELAAVMAHEYAHVYARHVRKGMDRQYVAMGGALAAGVLGYTLADDNKLEVAGLAAVGAGMLGSFLNQGFTRDDEAEADSLGFEFYARAGWDPARFGDFFQAMIDLGYDTTPEMMSDHPTLASRVVAARAAAAKLPADAKSWRKPAVAEGPKFKAMQSRAAQIAKSLPKDQTMETAQTLLNAVGNCLMPTDQPQQIEARTKVEKALGN